MKYQLIVTILVMAFNKGLGYPQSNTFGGVSVSAMYQAEDDSDMYLEPDHAESQVDETEDREPSQQTFYPSFSPFQHQPLGHSRPFFFQQEGAYSQRHSGFPQQQLTFDSPKFSGYKDTDFRAAANVESRGLLGSGNFGVIRGGTFYEKGSESSNYDSDYSPYFGNGHGRPSYFGGVPNPKPYKHEQFANFRDFADINTPSNPAYSEFVVVYVNKNATRLQENEELNMKIQKRPNNIIESLALLDVENVPTEIPQKKLSKSKAKLAKLQSEKKYKHKKNRGEAKVAKELHEPLLALS